MHDPYAVAPRFLHRLEDQATIDPAIE